MHARVHTQIYIYIYIKKGSIGMKSLSHFSNRFLFQENAQLLKNATLNSPNKLK